MTASAMLPVLVRLVESLPRDMPQQARYRQLLTALRELFGCDAAALLRLEGDWLTPLAVDGLSPDTLGRRFRLQDHPRLLAMLGRRGPTRLDADCDLPDPYDGLVEGRAGQLEVHDCMGCPLYVDDKPWGLLTLDALDANAFARVDLDMLQAFAAVATAMVVAAERIERLTHRAEQEQQIARAVLEGADQRRSRALIGQSAAMHRLRLEIDAVAGTDLTVLSTLR